MTIPAQRTSRAFHDIGGLVDHIWPAGAGAKLGIIPHHQYLGVITDTALAGDTSEQSPFAAANDNVAVAAATRYRFRGQYSLVTGATSHTTAVGFTLTTATLASIRYNTIAWSAADDTLAAAQCRSVEVATASVITAASTAVETNIHLSGELRTTLGGTIKPFLAFSADPQGDEVVQVGSFFEIWPVGLGAVAAFGNVS